MSEIFDKEAVDRLIECMKENSVIDEVQEKVDKSRKKLLAAVKSEVEGEELEALIQETLVVVESETRIIVRALQNQIWMRRMKEKIKAKNPEILEKAEILVGRTFDV